MDHAGIEAVDEVRLAGAFGSQIDPLHAMVLGLIPDCDLDRVKAAGNSAGTGAMIALLSAAARREIEDVTRRVEKIETAVEPRFQEHFVDALAFPHRHGALPEPRAACRAPEAPVRRRQRECRRRRGERRRRREVAAASRDRT